MSDLENRLRLSRRQCEERQRYLVGLEALAEKLRADQCLLWAKIELASVEPLSPKAGSAHLALCACAERGSGGSAGEFPVGELLQRHRKLARSIGAIETQIIEVGAALGLAEQELKRHELAAAQRLARTGLSERRRGS